MNHISDMVTEIWISTRIQNLNERLLIRAHEDQYVSMVDLSWCQMQNCSINKKAQLSLTNPRDACEKFARLT